MATILLSIKPEYASAIAKGIKKVEFRKRIFSETVERAFVYSSSPVKKIIGSFLVSHIEKGIPDYIWEKYSKCGSISRDKFFDYFLGVGTENIPINSILREFVGGSCFQV